MPQENNTIKDIKETNQNIIDRLRLKISHSIFLKQTVSTFTALFLLMLFFSIAASPNFFTTTNLLSIAQQTAIIGVIALGQTIVLITGGIDLSIGSNIALAGMVSAFFVKQIELPIPVAMILGLCATTMVGTLNGVLVAYAKLPPFVVTLGTVSIFRGVNFVMNNGRPFAPLPDAYRELGNGTFYGVPFPIIIMIMLTIIFFFILTKTKLGVSIYAVGSNKEASTLSGINSEKILVCAYLFSGFLAGVGGLIFSSRLVIGQPGAGTGYELFAVASSVIGGTSLSGGEGNIFGTLIGALIIGVLRNGLNLMGLSSFIQDIFIGIVIILAVFLDKIKELKSK